MSPLALSPARVVIDTNVLVSALLSPDGAPARVANAVVQGRLAFVADVRILTEYVDVLTRPKFRFTKEEVNAFAAAFFPLCEQVTPALLPVRLHLPDAGDVLFVEAALGAGGVPIVTGNRRHFPEKEALGLLGIDVLSSSELVKLLG
jgi:putative PIN family toxin of toxin-antitoxin system